MLALHIRVKARTDLKEIWKYSYKKFGETQADKYLDELDSGMEDIQNNPKIGLSSNNIRPNSKCYKINSHFIFYKIGSSQINIIRILHESMNMTDHL